MLTRLADYARSFVLPKVTTRQSRFTRCRGGSEVQTLLFDKRAGWTIRKAKAWAAKHKFVHRKVDVTANFIRLRQRDPKLFQVMRVKPFGRSGVKAVVGWRDC